MFTAESIVTSSAGKGVTFPSRPAEGAAVAGFPDGVVYCHSKVKGSLGSGGLSVSGNGNGSPGVYVPATPDKCNVGVLSGGDGFFFSDQFGGCDFTVMKTPEGNWAGSHVYSSDTCRKNIAAIPSDWTTVYTWRSGPYARKFGMSGSLTVFCFITSGNLKFVMVRVKGFPPTVDETAMSANVRL